MSVTVANVCGRYDKKTHVEQILLRPDTYVGSVTPVTEKRWVVDEFDAKGRPVYTYRNVTYTPALENVLDELVVNACDHAQRGMGVTKIKLTVNEAEGWFSVHNDGEGIPVLEHPEHKQLIPAMIFGELLTGSSYDDSALEAAGGRNGYGAKLANLFATRFDVETSCREHGEACFVGRWKNNMSEFKHKLKQAAKADYTLVRVYPEWSRFGLAGWTRDVVSLMRFRACEVAATTVGVAKPTPASSAVNQGTASLGRPPQGTALGPLSDKGAAVRLPGRSRRLTVSFNGRKVAVTGFRQFAVGLMQAAAGSNDSSGDGPESKAMVPDDVSVGAASVASSSGGDAAGLGRSSIKVPHVYVSVGGATGGAEHKIVPKSAELEYVVCASPSGEHTHHSYANNIRTSAGGVHVRAVTDTFVRVALDVLKSKHKALASSLSASVIRSQLWVLVNVRVLNPHFTSQVKVELAGPKVKVTVPTKVVTQALSSGVFDGVLSLARGKSDSLLKKTDGAQTRRVKGVTKLEDANWAGTVKSLQCTLVLTEGDSAKALAMAGLGVVGRDRYGVFPLRGKLLNVRSASQRQLEGNEEVKHLKKILGLRERVNYLSDAEFSKLRYGRVMLFADADIDGSHIKGLVINFLAHGWPSLLQRPGFLVQFQTPIVRVFKGSGAHAKSLDFNSQHDFEAWVQQQQQHAQVSTEAKDQSGAELISLPKGWRAKYFKGLGTSTPADAKTYFADMKSHLMEFQYSGAEDFRVLERAFGKKEEQTRKQWIQKYGAEAEVITGVPTLTFADFVNRELVLYSLANCQRSIPSLTDGLKPSQRKIIWCLTYASPCKHEDKLTTLGGLVTQKAAYHHGEASLYETIIKLAQNYVGSNNWPLLYPAGQFGTRHMSGSDAASARYLFTSLQPYLKHLFPPEDMPGLKRVVDDGRLVEPVTLAPVLPPQLLNGTAGIGTGWSTNVLPYHHRALYNAVVARLSPPGASAAGVGPLGAPAAGVAPPGAPASGVSPSGAPAASVVPQGALAAAAQGSSSSSESAKLRPWWRGFTGVVRTHPTKPHVVVVEGVLRVDRLPVVEITELPVGQSTHAYKLKLEELCQSRKLVLSFTENHTNARVHFVLRAAPEAVKSLGPDPSQWLQALKLTTTFSTANMVMFDTSHKLKRYTGPEAVLDEFVPWRLSLYVQRKARLEAELQDKVNLLQDRVRFLELVVSGRLVVANRGKRELEAELAAPPLSFPPRPKSKSKGKSSSASSDSESDPESDDENEANEGKVVPMDVEAEIKSGASSAIRVKGGYDYLLGLSLWSLTRERLVKEQTAHQQKVQELQELKATTAVQLWLHELDQLVEALDADEQRRLREEEEGNQAITAKRKRTKKQTGVKRKRQSKLNLVGQPANQAKKTKIC